MKAYQVMEHGAPLLCRDVETPKLGDHEVLAKTLVTGVCHTDVHVVDGDWGKLSLPLTPGHEGVGIVVSVGPNVKTLKVGDRIGVPWLGQSCMDCYLCKDGRENLCENQKQTGFIRNGSFAEYFAADERFAARIPENISDAAAAPVLCAGVTAYKALRLANVERGARIVISGACGGLGHMAIQYAKGMGLEVVALDVMDAKKSEMMKKFGADFVVDVKDTSSSLADRMKSLDASRKPIQASIIFAPALAAVSDAIDYVSPGATIVCVALPAGKFEIDVVSFILKELRLQGSIVGTPKDLAEALELVSQGRVQPHVEVKEMTSLNSVLSDLKSGKVSGRVVLRVGDQ